MSILYLCEKLDILKSETFPYFPKKLIRRHGENRCIVEMTDDTCYVAIQPLQKMLTDWISNEVDVHKDQFLSNDLFILSLGQKRK